MDDERGSDTAERFDEAPGAGGVSSQNHEEAPAPGVGGSGEVAPDEPERERAGREAGDDDDGAAGGAGEGSQSTGSPHSAG